MRAVVVMPPTKEGPSRTYAGCTCSMSVSEALEIDLPVRDGPAGPDEGGTVYCDFSMLPDELGRRAARALVSMAAALRGDDSEFPWGEPDPVGVGIALQVLSCLPERNAIGEGPVYRIAFREVSLDPGEAEGHPPAQDRSVPAALPGAPAGNETRRTRRFLKTSEAGAFVGLSGKTLARMRVTGGGPVYSKRGTRVFYDIADLETWMEEGKRRFTAEASDQS